MNYFIVLKTDIYTKFQISLNIVLSAWNEKKLMLLIKYFGIERLKPYIVKLKDIKLLKSFNQHVKYLARKQ